MPTHRALPFALALACAGCGDDTPARFAAFRDNFFLTHEGTLNIAHRGGVLEAPEHTLLAYRHALDVGADVLELDVHLTSDGELVVMHDTTVDRTTEGEGPIAGFSLEELRTLDAAYRFTLDGGASYPERGQGHGVPTVREVFERFPDAPYVIELKTSSLLAVPALVALIEEFGLRDRVVLASVSSAVVDELRAAQPPILTSFTLAEGIAFYTLTSPDAEASYEPPSPLLQTPSGTITETVLERARRLGIRLHAFTVNDETEMQSLIDRGVEGIITDRPSLLDSLL